MSAKSGCVVRGPAAAFAFLAFDSNEDRKPALACRIQKRTIEKSPPRSDRKTVVWQIRKFRGTYMVITSLFSRRLSTQSQSWKVLSKALWRLVARIVEVVSGKESHREKFGRTIRMVFG